MAEGGAAAVYHALKRDITHFAFKPGERLVEEQLCQRYGVSRTPIREALRRIEQDGLIVSKGSLGRVVPHFEVSDYEDLYRVRIALEELSVTQACENLDEDALRALRGSWEEGVEGALLALDGSYVHADERFHVGVALLTQNRFLVESLLRINDRIRIIRMVDFTNRERIWTTRDQHNDILDALEGRDAERGRSLMRDHIEQSKSNIRELISRALTRIYLGDRS